MFTFVPLQGALSESTASQHLLELDGGVKVLIDVGWDESFDVEKLKELEKYVSSTALIPSLFGTGSCNAPAATDNVVPDKSLLYR